MNGDSNAFLRIELECKTTPIPLCFYPNSTV